MVNWTLMSQNSKCNNDPSSYTIIYMERRLIIMNP
jgi:hypothetical protein